MIHSIYRTAGGAKVQWGVAARTLPGYAPTELIAKGRCSVGQAGVALGGSRGFVCAAVAILCQDVCHVLRNHHLHDEFVGPRFFVHVAALEMHPLDDEDRLEDLRETLGVGYCNIPKCCTKVCPESITITDNGIIPLKERVVGRFFDPLGKLFARFRDPGGG